jgi:hypothetical protein
LSEMSETPSHHNTINRSIPTPNGLLYREG